jgi:uncharacterized protein YdhG (YjbR/CyaY superfamily)
MKTKRTAPRTIDDYIAGFPASVQALLEKIRATIHRAAPGAEEKISYQMPAFTLDGKYLVYVAAYQKHIGLYPAPRGSEEFQAELSRYAGGKGTIQFPLDQPIPYGLIRRIVKYRIRTNREKAAERADRRSARRPVRRAKAATRRVKR